MARVIDDIGTLFRGGQSTVRLGVTGLSRAGKTVFITSLIANLLERDRMTLLRAEAQGEILAARLDEQPDKTLPRFEYENHIASLLKPTPAWPESTRNISQMRLSFRVQRRGLGSLLGETKTVHVDIIDYPGEWLLDLGLMNKDYNSWSQLILDRLRQSGDLDAQQFIRIIDELDTSQNITEVELGAHAREFTDLVRARHKSGVHDLIPGRFLLPGEIEGAPVVTFVPLPPQDKSPRGSVYNVFERRYRAYQREVIRPFFKDHFAKLDRQLVLVDLLAALEVGPDALAGLEAAIGDILTAFNTGKNGLMSMLLGSKIDRIGFVATKADLLHHHHHEKLVDLMRAILQKTERDIQYQGVQTSAKAVASLRSTVEDVKTHDGEKLHIVKGRNASDNRSVGFHFGELPRDAQSYIIAPDDREFSAPKLAPPDLTARSHAGLPHIRLDQTVEFIIGDKLRG